MRQEINSRAKGRQDQPTHRRNNLHIKERKRRPIAIDRAALLEQLYGGGDAVDDDDGLAEDVEVDEVGI